MRNFWRFVGFLVFLIILGIGVFGWRLLNAAGVFTAYTPASAGTCTALTGVVGAEDLQIDRTTNEMFVSAYDRRASADAPNAQDGIYVMHLGNKDSGFTKLSGAPADFHPHGLSLYRAADGTRTLMVINHPTPSTSAVEIFDVVEGPDGLSLHSRATVTGDLLYALNDLVAIGSDRFYAVSEMSSHSVFGSTIELFALIPGARVIYYDGQTSSVAAKGLTFTAGINASPDTRYVYVSELTGRRLDTFQGDPLTGKLTKISTFPIPAGLDNITIDTDWNLWIASHPKTFKLMSYAKHPDKPSPSEIWKVFNDRGVPKIAKPIYVNSGEEIGASSVGAMADGHLYIGSVFDPKVLDCTLTPGIDR